MLKTVTHSVFGVVVGVALTGLLLYTAQQSSNSTVKNLAKNITAGFGAAA